MILIIDLSGQPTLILKDGEKIKAKYSWNGLYNLNEKLLIKIDKFLKKNKIQLKHIEKIKIKPGGQSLVGDRIAKAISLGLKTASEQYPDYEE